MKRFIFLVLVTCSIIVTAVAQNSDILLTIDGHPVTKAEFEYNYKKNNSNVYSRSDKKSPKEYLDLFIDFKLKVIEAQNLKMDTSRAFINELAGYRKEIAAPYLTDTNFDDQLVHKMYQRMTREVDASHILLLLDANATAEKEAEVETRIKAIRQEILNGKDFGAAAVEYSEDPSAKNNQGHLGYFTAFTMVYPFEDAAFETPVGEISQPVRTKFGYHLIKVNDVRKNKGEILVAQIMKSFPKGASEETKRVQKAKIDSLYQQLLDGADFAQLAREHSDDRQSASKGGELPWFTAGRMIAEFADPAFALKNIGDFTPPVESAYGYHIIKKLDARPVPPFDKIKATIENRIKRDPARNNFSQHVFIAHLKDEYQFKVSPEGKAQLQKINLHESDKLAEVPLFSLKGKNFNGSDFSAWLKQQKLTDRENVNDLFNQWVNDEIIAFENTQLETKYPEFRFLMNEYHDGILLFTISQEKIWNFANQDSSGLQTFYQKLKKKHLWGERFKGNIITCKSAEVREQADQLFGAGMNADEVCAHLNTNDEVISMETGAWERGDNAVVDFYVWNGAKPESFDSQTVYVRGNKVAPEAKTLEEARGLYISDYQKYLEKEWLKKLHSKYKVKVNRKLLKTIDAV